MLDKAQALIDISTHTLTWSVTADRGKITPEQYISTHTLTWSVTSKLAKQVADDLNFNSHAHVERDDSVIELIPIITISTHTLTWSVTSRPSRLFELLANFNSHAHVERDVFQTAAYRIFL